jgi:hypothetical protein
VLTRNEGVFLVVALMIEHFRLRRKFPDVRYFILPIFILVAHLIFNYSYYGAFLPETGSAKIYQGMSGLWGIEKPIFITKSDYLIDWVFGGNLIVFYTLLFMAFLGVYGIGISSLNVIVIIMLLLLLLFYSSLNIPNYHWYNAPFLFFMFMYAAEGLNVVRDLFNKVICNKKVCIILIMLIAICPIYNNFNNLRFGKSNHPYVEIGKWIKNNTSKDASIAMVEIGMVGYFSDRRIIDILGLVNPYNAKFIGEKKFGKWLSKYSPEYILAHEPYWGHEVGIIGAVKAGKYLEWTKFDFKGYKLFVRNDIDISKAELINPYKDITIYEGIFFQNRYLDPLNFSVRDYVSKKYNEKVLFSHVGTQFKVSGDVLRMMVSGNHIDFGIGILDDAYQNEHYSQGACFEIYENEVNEINLKFSQCIDPANSYTDRGILENKLDIKNMESEYIFKVIQRPGKSSAWGWSFWVFGAK